jgi:acetoacetyl-CoA synthetase
MTWQDFVSLGQEKKLGVAASGDIQWWRGPFDWPLWILFSSGTTSTYPWQGWAIVAIYVVLADKPKPIVHRAGGMLLQSKKEFVICADMTEDDVFFYYTTTFVQ